MKSAGYLIALMGCIAAQFAFAGAKETPIPPLAARACDGFCERACLNIRLGLPNSPYLKYEALVKPRLLELGVRAVRTTCESPESVAMLNDLAAAQIQSHVIVKPAQAVAVCKALKNVVAIEGPCEPDRVEGWVNVTREQQKALYGSIRALPAFKNVIVAGPMLADAAQSEKLGLFSDAMDYGSLRDYPPGLNPMFGSGGRYVVELMKDVRKVCGPMQGIYFNEFGYHNGLAAPDGSGVPEAIAGRYIIRHLLHQVYSGGAPTYIYELFDAQADPKNTDKEKHFGLCRYDGSPKPAFSALKKFMTLMKDSGPVFTPEALAYRFAGSYKNLRQCLAQKRSGVFYLFVWFEEPSFDPKTQRVLNVPGQEVVIELGQPIKSISAWHPLVENERPRPLAEFSKVRLPVNDEVLLLEIELKR